MIFCRKTSVGHNLDYSFDQILCYNADHNPSRRHRRRRRRHIELK